MYPEGHARCDSGNRDRLLHHKFLRLAELGVDDPESLHRRMSGLAKKSPQEVRDLYAFPIRRVLR
jgi:hypothetical protein